MKIIQVRVELLIVQPPCLSQSFSLWLFGKWGKIREFMRNGGTTMMLDEDETGNDKVCGRRADKLAGLDVLVVINPLTSRSWNC